MQTKTNVVYKYLLLRWLKNYGTVLAVIVGFDVLTSINYTNSFKDFLVRVFNTSYGAVAFISVAFVAFECYVLFGYLMQNSISRTTFFKATMLKLLSASLIVSCFTHLMAVIQNALKLEALSVYTVLYGKFFKSNALNYVLEFLSDYLILVCIGAILIAIVTFFTLCNRLTKIIILGIIVGGPMMWIIFGINLFLENIGHIQIDTYIGNLMEGIFWLFGYRVDVVVGHYNPLMLFIILILLSIIGMALSYFLMQRLKIRTV